jgi:endo-1,4-beta-xylanase
MGRIVMKKQIVICVGLLIMTGWAFGGEPPLPEGRRLREIVAEKYPEGSFYVGVADDWGDRPNGIGLTMDREMNYVTPENDYKLSRIHPEPGRWSWDRGDRWVKKCAEQGQVIRIHGPISPQCSRWVEDDSRTPEELTKLLTEYMTELCRRYDKYEHVVWMDVVNEVVLANGQWHGPRPGTGRWEMPWTKIGFDESHSLRPPLYIKMAFEIATRHAPNTKLVINQHCGMQDAAWDKIRALVPYLRDQGLRVDGIGWQAHINTGWEKEEGNLEKLGMLIDWTHARGMDFHITEINSWLKGNQTDAASYRAQGETFAAVMRVLLEHRAGGVVTWNAWNTCDKHAYKKEWNGCLFDDRFEAKPAYYAIQKLLENPPPVKHGKEIR